MHDTASLAATPRAFSDELQAIAANFDVRDDNALSWSEAYREIGSACDKRKVAFLRQVEDAGLSTRSIARDENTRYIALVILDRESRRQLRASK